jgi:uncharacterized membrane protein YcaP (DUF421 family)
VTITPSLLPIVVCTIGLTHLFVSWPKTRSDIFGRIIDGTPVIIYQRSVWKKDRMRRLRVELQDVTAAIR